MSGISTSNGPTANRTENAATTSVTQIQGLRAGVAVPLADFVEDPGAGTAGRAARLHRQEGGDANAERQRVERKRPCRADPRDDEAHPTPAPPCAAPAAAPPTQVRLP